jgi:hypothetical protein
MSDVLSFSSFLCVLFYAFLIDFVVSIHFFFFFFQILVDPLSLFFEGSDSIWTAFLTNEGTAEDLKLLFLGAVISFVPVGGGGKREV